MFKQTLINFGRALRAIFTLDPSKLVGKSGFYEQDRETYDQLFSKGEKSGKKSG